MREKGSDCMDLSPVDLYLEILRGKRRRFPPGFFQEDIDNAATKEVVRYFVRNILRLTKREEILWGIRKDGFTENKLGGLLSKKYRSSPSEAVMDAFPEMNMKVWEFHAAQNSYWRGDEGRARAIEAFHDVYYGRLGLRPEEVGKNLTHDIIRREGLNGALRYGFSGSVQIAAKEAFPGVCEPWEIGAHVPNDYWTKERGVEAFRWLVESKLRLSREEVPLRISRELLRENDLYGMIQSCFGSNIYSLLDAAYPGKYKPWDVARVPPGYWTEKTSKEALRHLVEERLEFSREEAWTLSKDALVKNGLFSVIENNRHMSVKELIEWAYESEEN